MFKALTNEEFLQKLDYYNVEDTPLEKYNGAHTKIKWQCHVNSNHIYYSSPSDVYGSKYGCPYCAHQKVFIGETDMWTTNPNLANMLHNPEDGYKYFECSTKKVDWDCPICGSLVKDRAIESVCRHGLSCDNCSDGMSFAEKFVSELFNQLCCDAIHDRATIWSCGKRYDFYVPSMSLIVETHGIQHYDESFIYKGSKRSTRTINEEIKNDSYKRELAVSNGILNYIELDCRYSNPDYIKDSILNSKLSELFDLSCIDWDMCFEATITSNVVLCADLWNNGMKNTGDIADYTGIHISSVISNLKKAAKINICDYVPNYKKNKNSYKRVLCEELNKSYECISRVSEDGYNPSNVSCCCNGKTNTAYGMHWRFI